MDIAFRTESGKFNYRACAVIIHEDKILAMHDERSPYYYLPGGRVQFGETAESAVLRELREELQIDAEILRPLWMNQSFFTEDVSQETFHEICIYFLIDISETDILSKGSKFILYEDNHFHEFHWLAFGQLQDEYLYPAFIKENVSRLPEEFTLRSEWE